MLFQFSGPLLAKQHDNEQERPPPLRPAPLTFPSFTPPEPTSSGVPNVWTNGPTPAIPQRLLRLKKPSDVNVDTLAVLNVSFRDQGDFEWLLSSLPHDALSYLPPKDWLAAPGPAGSSSSELPVRLLCNGRKLPDRTDFYNRAKELLFRNEDAYSNLSRKSNGTPVQLRLAHFRKFWEGLDNMAYYWDTSLDEYLPPKADDSSNPILSHSNEGKLKDITKDKPNPPSSRTPEATPTVLNHAASPGTDEPRKKVKTEPNSSETLVQPAGHAALPPDAIPNRASSIASSRQLPARTAPPKVPWITSTAAHAMRPADLSGGAYKGLRIGNGAEMPEPYRFECVRSFLEPIAWTFGVTLVPHRRPPVLTVGNVRFPVRMNSVAWRSPLDRTLARQGYLEGPLLGIQCRPDIAFGAEGPPAAAVLDAVRELGGLLLLAQERAKQGKVENRRSEGKWWATQHRWGGGPGGEVGEATGMSDAAEAQTNPQLDEKLAARARIGGKERRRPSPAEIWKVVRQGQPLWDPKTIYEAIGKDPDSEWDEIFMVSSINHHISVLKLRVHRLYIEHLTDGSLPDRPTNDTTWPSPQLSRTKWYNLFDTVDRAEAMRGIWGIMAYLMRAKHKDIKVNEHDEDD